MRLISIFCMLGMLFRATVGFCAEPQSPPSGGVNTDHAQIVDVNGLRPVRLIVRLKPASGGNVHAPAMAITMATQTIKLADVVGAHQIAANLVALTIPPNRVSDVAKNSAIEAVYIDKLSKPLLQNSVPLIKADELQQAHLSGNGYVIAVLDSGVDGQHPALKGKVVAEACYSSNSPSQFSTSLCPSGNDSEIGVGAAIPCPTTMAGCEHGTHVAGIAASGAYTYNNKPIVGVAPGSSVIAVQVFSRISDPTFCGQGIPSCIGSWESDQISALDYVWSVSPNKKIAAVNMSIGSGGQYLQNCDDAMKSHIDQLRAVGILTVIAAGNDGYSNALGSPACISSAISVGASNGSDGIALNFSDRAPFMTLVAPGVGIISTWPISLGGGYQALDGTSQATPFVAGTIALLRSAYPQATADQIESALTGGTQTLTDPASGQHFALLNAQIALNNIQHEIAAVPQSVNKAPVVSNSNTENNSRGNAIRVIATAPLGFQKPSDILVQEDKGLVVEEKKISGQQFTVTAPASVINKLRASMLIQPNRLAKPEVDK